MFVYRLSAKCVHTKVRYLQKTSHYGQALDNDLGHFTET